MSVLSDGGTSGSSLFEEKMAVVQCDFSGFNLDYLYSTTVTWLGVTLEGNVSLRALMPFDSAHIFFKVTLNI